MRCVLSFTTLPSRIERTRPMVESLLAQSLQPDEIYLWLPTHYKRLAGAVEVPDWLRELPITVGRVLDHGPITKLLPTLQCETDPKTLVVTADDDMYYPPWWLSYLVGMWEQFRGVVASRGRVFASPEDRRYRSTRVIGGRKGVGADPAPVDLVTGVEGILYQVGYFDRGVFDSTACPSAFYNDDIWISGHLSSRGVPRRASGIRGISTLPYHDSDALRQIDRRKDHEDRIVEHFSGTLGRPPTNYLQKRWRITRRACS